MAVPADTGPRRVRLHWARRDRYRLGTLTALVGLAATLALARWGLPQVDLHGPLHRIGIMGPFCGGTRAAYYTATGDWVRAWAYNPLGIAAVGAAVLGTLRAGIGLVAGRWLTVNFFWTRRTATTVAVLGVVLVAALEVRQQLHAPLLMAGTHLWR